MQGKREIDSNTDLTIKCRIPSFHSVYSFIVASAFTNKLLSSRNAAFINQIGIIPHKSDLDVLSFFEGDDYKLAEVDGTVGSKNVRAGVFIWDTSLEFLGKWDWNKNEFKRKSLAFYLEKVISETLEEYQNRNRTE